jgi:hypothetical protein
MSLQTIQEEIVEVLKTYFKDQHFSENGYQKNEGPAHKLNIFKQSVPDKSTDQDFVEDWEYPFITVSLMSGSTLEERRTKIVFGLGIKDKQLDYSGHLSILSIIEKLGALLSEPEHFKYSTPEISYEWALNEGDYYPYYFGVVETHWSHM